MFVSIKKLANFCEITFYNKKQTKCLAKSLLATFNLPNMIIDIFTHPINLPPFKKNGPFHVERTIIEIFQFLIFITRRENFFPENTNKHILDTIILVQIASEYDNKI
jgi:hypothetical protein